MRPRTLVLQVSSYKWLLGNSSGCVNRTANKTSHATIVFPSTVLLLLNANSVKAGPTWYVI